MALLDECERVARGPASNEFGGRFRAPVVHNDNLKTGRIRLASQRLQALLKRAPVVIYRYNDAKKSCSFVPIH